MKKKRKLTREGCGSSSRKIVRVMKITFLFLFVAVFEGLASNAYSQNARVSVNMTNSTVKQVLQNIEGQSDYNFFYNEGLIDMEREVSVVADNKKISSVLNTLFKGTNVSYDVRGTQIILSNQNPSGVKAGQQQGVLTGTVVDEDGVPLPGVSVVIKGTTNGVTTDINGKYRIPVSSVAKTIVFSFVGMASQEVNLTNQESVNVVLKTDAQGLDEVIVVGYGVMKKANLSGAVGHVSAKALENRPVSNIGAALQGTLPSMNVTISSGRSTEAPEFNIRGLTTIGGTSNSPLILVDNIPVTASELARINPDDVANVSVLKDAASAAIYGARAAFGVILLTTKEAKSKDLKFSYNNNFSWRKITRRTEVITDPLKVMQIKDVMGAPWYDLYNEADFAYGKKRSEDPSLPATIVDPSNPNRWKHYGNTNWFDQVYNDYSPSQTHSVNLTQKGERVSHYFSGSFYKQDGMFKFGNDVLKRYNLRNKETFDVIKDVFKLKMNSLYSYSEYNAPYNSGSGFFHGINRLNTLGVPYNPDGSATEYGARYVDQLKKGGRSVETTSDYQVTIGTELNLIKDVWKVFADATFKKSEVKGDSYWFPMSYRLGPDQPLKSESGNSFARKSASSKKYEVYNLYTNFNKVIGKHDLKVMVGYNQESKHYNWFKSAREKLISNNLPSIQLATGDKYIGEDDYGWSVRGAFYRLNYIFDNKYIFETNGRYDGTSRFPSGDRFGFFPSASLAYVVSQESFFEGLKPYFSNLKLRASYGSLGNQNVGYYGYIPEMEAYKISQVLNGEQPMAVDNPGLVAASLTWEKVVTKNIGIDMGFFDNRLMVEADVYRTDTKDMLTKGKTLPSVLGASVPKENAADLKTEGWELSVNWNDRVSFFGKDLTYGAKFSLADSRVYITRYDNPTKRLGDYYEGKELGEIWGLDTEGFFTSAEDVASHADQSSVSSYPGTRPIEAGDLKFKDRNGDNVINDGDWTADNAGDYHVIGNSRARYIYSFDSHASWNGFDLRVFLQGVGKKDYYPGAGTHYFWGVYAQPWANVLKTNLDHWTPENPNGYFPRLKSYTAEQNYRALGNPQTKYLQDASYLRVKNVTLGYTFPKSLTQKVKIDYLRVFFSGENLFEFTSLPDDMDPEILGATKYPMQRVYSFGMNVRF